VEIENEEINKQH